jgi:hypothetical protein
MMTVCSECKKAVDEDDTSGCIHCSELFCDVCERNGVTCSCQQVLNQIWDAEEAAAARIARLVVN